MTVAILGNSSKSTHLLYILWNKYTLQWNKLALYYNDWRYWIVAVLEMIWQSKYKNALPVTPTQNWVCIGFVIWAFVFCKMYSQCILHFFKCTHILYRGFTFLEICIKVASVTFNWSQFHYIVRNSFSCIQLYCNSFAQ